MYTVYVLYSLNFKKIYIGVSGNVEARLQAHNHVNNKGWTRSYKPWTIIYTEEFRTKGEALKREKELKSSRGRNFIWSNILQEYGSPGSYPSADGRPFESGLRN